MLVLTFISVIYDVNRQVVRKPAFKFLALKLFKHTIFRNARYMYSL